MHLIEMVLGYGILSVRNKVIKRTSNWLHVVTFELFQSEFPRPLADCCSPVVRDWKAAECSHTTQHANLAAVCGQTVGAPINNNNGHRAVLR